MIPSRALVPLALLLLTLLGFTVFPGHTWLQSDTQIYIPILERQFDHSLFSHDEIALRPHVKFTLYDEITVGLRQLTGLNYDILLPAQQFLFRIAGITGVFLLAQACGLPVAGSLLAAGIFALGAVINGPSVLTFEYEPVPRGFAIMLVFGALGCAAQHRWAWAGALAILATLYHPTTTAPFWACLVLHWLIAHDRREKIVLFGSIAIAGLSLAALAWHQAYGSDIQVFLGRIPPELERIQKFRGAYNWISLWPAEWFWQYPVLLTAALLAWRRIRASMTPEARFLTLALVIYGFVMIPLQYVLLDVGKWILMPQFQPARAVLFITALAGIMGTAAGWFAAAQRRWWEAAAWFVLVFAIPVNGLVIQLFTGGDWRRIAVTALLAALALAAAARPLAALPVAIAAFFVVPYLGGVRSSPDLHSLQLDEAAAWARVSTDKNDVFLFPTVEHGLDPGIFRARSLRALYVDWKSGGQANLLKDYGFEWWKRWHAINRARPPLRALDDYRKLGIDYLVVRPGEKPANAVAVFENSGWSVIVLKPAPTGNPPPRSAKGSMPALPAS